MSVPDALRLLDLRNSSYTPDQLRVAYKRMALLHHPDKGGDTLMMQKINAAYDKLSQINGGSGDSFEDRRNRWEQEKAKDHEFLQFSLIKVKSTIDLHAFAIHFQEIFGEPFSVSEKERENDSFADIQVEFHNAGRTTVLDLQVHISASERRNTGLGTGDSGINMYISTTILHNRRKIKLTQSNYKYESDYKILSQPEILFPAKKLKAKKDGPKGKFSKKDAVLAFQKELHAEWDGEWLRIPLPFSDNLRLVMYRTTLMGYGSWCVNGLYRKSGRVGQPPFTSFGENERIINWLIDELKEVQKLSDQSAIEAKLKHMIEYYKNHVRSMEQTTVDSEK